MNKQNLLLIDNRILDLSDIIESIKLDVSYIIIDYYNDTFTDLINRIQNLNITSISSVGLIRHGYFLSTYKFLDKQIEESIVNNVQLLDSSLNTWSEIKTFILNLKNNYQIEYFDFISCRLDKYSDYHYIFDEIEKQLNINIGASTDDVGNLQYGGNWILETTNTNLLDIYFNLNILDYPYLFFTPVLEIKANTYNKYYNGVYFTNPEVTYNGFIDNDTYLSLSGFLLYTGTYQDALLAGSYSIIPYGYVSYKYYLNFINGTLNILPSILNISINNYIKIYNGLSDLPNYVINYSGFIPGEDYTCLSGILTLSGTFINAKNAGNYTIIPSGLYSSNYQIIYKTTILTIVPATLLIIANNVTKIYDRIPYYGGDGVIYDGFQNNDSILSLSGVLTYIGNSQGAYQIGTYSIMPSGYTSQNYNITYIDGTLTIYTNSFLIKANDFIKFYDNLFFSNPSVSYTGDINDLSGTLYFYGSFLGANDVINSPYTIQPNGLYSSNYTITYFDGYLKIDLNEVYVIANDITKIYDSIPYVDIPVTYQGLQGTDTSANLTGSLLNIGSSLYATSIGNYLIIPSNLYSTNYNVLYKQGTLTIKPAPLYLNLQSFTKVYDGTTDIENNYLESNIIYSISGIVNNEIINIISYTARFKKHTAGIHFIDISNITLSGFTLSNYYIVPVPPLAGTILPRFITASFSGGNKTYDGTRTPGLMTYSLSGMLGLENISISSYFPLFRVNRAGPQIIDISYVILFGFTAPNYIVAPVLPIMALIYQNFITITFYGGNKVYDSYGTPGPLTYTIQGVFDPITISSYVAKFRDPHAGTKLIDVSSIVLTGPNAYTYSPPAQISFYATIFPIYITTTFYGGNKIYDGTRGSRSLTYSLSGMVANEIVTISDYVARFKNFNAGLQILDISYVVLFGESAQDYLIRPIFPINATIFKKALNATFTGGHKTYDGTTIPSYIIGSLSGMVVTEFYYTKNISGSFMTPSFPVKVLGNYNISGFLIDRTYDIDNIWIVYRYGVTSNIYLDNSNNLVIDPIKFYNYKVTDTLGPSSIYYTTLSNIIYYPYMYVDPSSNIVDSNAKWIWTDISYSLLQFQTLYSNKSNALQYGTIYSNINGNATLYFNGKFLGTTNYLYSTYRFPILILPGINSLVITVSGNINPGILITVLDNITNLVLLNSNSNWISTFNQPIITYNYYLFTPYLDDVFITNFNAIYQNPNAGLSLIDVSNIEFDGGSINNYYINSPPAFNANIYKRNLTVRFNGGSKIYDTTTFTGPMTFSISGMINSSINNTFLNYFEDLTISTYISTFRSELVGNQIIDISYVVIQGKTQNNYNLLPVLPTSAFINYATLVASFSGGAKIYDGTRFTYPLNSSLSGIIGNDNVSISSFISFFRSPNVGNRIIDISFVTLQGTNSSNYRLAPILSISSYIFNKNIIALFSGGSKIYDGNYNTSTVYYSLSGIIGSEDVGIYYGTIFQNNNVGLNLIDVSNITLYGITSNNYLLSAVPAFNAFIYPKNISITFRGGSKIYDSYRNANTNIFGIINGLVVGEIVTISSFVAMFKDQNIGLRFIDISNIILSGPTAFNYNLLPIVSISGIISQRGLTATFTGGNKIYDSTRFTGPIIGSLSGIIGMENVTISTYIAFFKSGLAGNRFIDISFVTLQGPTAYNYFVNPVPVLTSYIDYKSLIASFTGGTKIYDSLYTTGPIQSSLSGIIGFDDVQINTYNSIFKLNTIGPNAIDISNLTLTGLQSSNYLVLPIPSFYSFINPRNLNITFRGGSKIYDSYRNANTNITGTINNIVPGEIITISSFIAMFKDQNIGLRFIDISDVILSGSTLFNYNLLPIVSISGIISQRGLTATFTGGNKIYDSTRFTGPIIGSLSGIIGMENVTISTYIAFFKSGLVGNRFIDISFVTLQGPTAYNYFVNPVPVLTSYIDYKSLIASFTGGTKIYDSLYTTGPIQSSLSGIISFDDVQINTYNSIFKLNTIGPNAIDISNLTLTGLQSSNYLVLPIPSFYSFINPRNLNITFRGGSKIYDSYRNANTNITGTINNIVPGEIITISSFVAMFKDQNVGLRFIDISDVILSGSTLFNYNLLPVVSISGIISQRGLTATFTGGNKIYDKTNITGTIQSSLSGIVSNENIFISSFTSTYQDIRAGARLIDISNIILSGFNPLNYYVFGVPPIVSIINQAPVIAYFRDGNKEYDATTIPFYTFNGYVTGGIGNDEVFLNNNFTGRFRSPNAGPQLIDVSFASIGGKDNLNYYLLPITPTNAFISYKKLTAIFTDGSKIYDGTNLAGQLNYTLLGIVNNENVTISSYIGLFRNPNTGLQIIDISNIILNGLFINYSLNNVLPIQANIYLKNLFILFTGGDKFYDKTTITGPSLTGTISGIVNNEIINIVSYSSSFNSSLAGLRTINFSNVILSGTTLNNYSVQPVLSILANIYPRNAQVYFTNADKLYDGKNDINTINYNFNNVISSDYIVVDNINGYFINPNVGYNQILITNASVVGTDVNNYIFTILTTLSANIYPRYIQAIFRGGNKFYDKGFNTGSISGFLLNTVPLDDVSISSFTSLFRNYNSGIQIIDISNIILGGSKASNYLLNPVLPINAYIFKQPLNTLFSISDKIYDGTNRVYTVNYLLSPIVPNDQVFISSYNALFSNINIGYNRIDISNSIILGNDSNNYRLNNVPSTYANILPKPVTVIFTDGNKNYDQTTQVYNLNYNIIGILSIDYVVVNSYNAIFKNSNAGLQLIDISNVILAGVGFRNYVVNPIPSINAIIYPKLISIIFINLSKIYDGTQSIGNTISSYIIGLLPNDQVFVQSFTGLYKNSLVGNTFLDISNIILGGLSSNNYYINPIPSLNTFISTRLLSFTFSGGNKIYDNTLVTGPINYSILNIANNENISINNFISRFRSFNTGIQLIDISNITISGFTIRNYSYLPYLTISANIFSQNVSISFTGLDKIYDNTNRAFVTNPIITGLVGNDILTVTISSYVSLYSNKFVETNKIINVNNIILTGLNATNYIISPSTVITYSNIYPKQLYLISNGVTKIYDQLTFATLSNIYLSGYFIDDINFISISSYIANYIDINYQLNKLINITNIILTGSYAFNYFINSTITFGNILQKTVPVNFIGLNKIYDGLTLASIGNITISNIISPDNVIIQSYNSNFLNPNVEQNKLIIINNITLSGKSGNNYNVNTSYTSATITFPSSLNINTTNNIVNYKDISNYLIININPVWQLSSLQNFNLININNNIIISDNGNIYDNNLTLINSTNYNFTYLNMVDQYIGFICGISGLILSTTNSFNTYTINNITNNQLKSISKLISRFIFAVGINGTVFKSSNNAMSWNQINVNTNTNLNDVYSIDTNITYIIGNNGLLLKTTNGGTSWSQNIISSNNLNSITMYDQYNGYIVGDNGTILKTNDGNNWIQINDISGNSYSIHNLNHVYILNLNDVMIVGNNGTILRSINRGITWFRYTSGTIFNLNRIYMYSSTNITIIGQNGIILYFLINPSGNLQLYDNNNLLLNIDVSANNPILYYNYNKLIVKNYNLIANFNPNQSNNYGISYSNIIPLTIQPLFYYLPQITDTLYERNNIIYSIYPFTDQSGGIFNILNNTLSFIIDQYSGQLTFLQGINVNNYFININYTLNSVSRQLIYNLIVRPNIYYPNNYTSLVYTISGFSSLPYFNQSNGIFYIEDLSGSLVTNNLVTINSSTGIIFFSNNIPINNYAFTVTYSLNSVTNSTIYLLNIKPYIIYLNNTTNLDYNTSKLSNSPLYLLTGGLFQIFDISYNLVQSGLVSINNLGIISFNSFINVNYYTFLIIYTFNNISNSTLYYLNASPYLKYPENSKIIQYDHTIYDASSVPIFIPNSGLFTITDLSGTLVSQNLVTINQFTGQIIFNLINVNAYMFNINYNFNNAFKNVSYGLLVIPSIYYIPNNININYNSISSSIIPYINPTNGTFNITEVDNILVQLNFVKVNYLTGIINFLSGINVGIYNFRIIYTINNISNNTPYSLKIIPNIIYSNNKTNLLYTISGISNIPTYSPLNGIFSLSGNLFSINNNGIITFGNNIDVGIYTFDVYYKVNNITNSYPYILTIAPIIYYQIPSINIQYKTMTNSIRPFTNQQRGTFTINDISSNFINLVPNFVYIDLSGIIYFNSGIFVGTYNFIIYYTLNNVTNFTYYNLIVSPNINYPLGYATLLYDRNTIFNSEAPIVDQSGGTFIINDSIGNLVSTNIVTINNLGIISFNTNINIQTYLFTIKYTLRNVSSTINYGLTVQPNVYYTISSLIINYNNSTQSVSPYYAQVGGIFTLYDLSNSKIAEQNYAAINQYGIITFNRIINVGFYNLLINYQVNNISNQTYYKYTVVPNLTYRINRTNILFDQSGNSLVPFYSQPGGVFNIYDLSGAFNAVANNLVFIDTNGMIYFNLGINVGIYYFNVVYTLNFVSSNFIYLLYVIPVLNYSDNNKILYYDRSTTTYSSSPASIYGGYFIITDLIGNLVNSNFVIIDSNTGIIQFNILIPVGKYSFSITYIYSGVQNSTIFNLSVLPNLYYSPNIISTYYNTPLTSAIPYYNQKNGSFTIEDVVGNNLSQTYLVQSNFISINPYNGIINFPRAIPVGNYQFLIKYYLNGINNSTYYFLTVIPLLTYTINFKNIDFGIEDSSIKPLVNQAKGQFYIYDLSNNGVYLNSVTIDINTGIINFSNFVNVGIYSFNIQYTLNNVSNYFIYYLNVYPILSYNPNNQILLYNRISVITSVLPSIQQLGGTFYFYDSSGSNLISTNAVYADISGALYFNNLINVGNYSFNIVYSLNNLSVLTNYFLTIIPNLEYTNTFNNYLYGTLFSSSIPYYEQKGGKFSYIDISNNLTKFLVADTSSGTFYITSNNLPNVGIYQLKIIYTLNNTFNTAYFIYYIIPIIYYKINIFTQLYNTSNFSILPLVNQPGGYFNIITYNSSGSTNVNGIFIDSSNGIIEFSNFVLVDTYSMSIIYSLNNVSNTTNYYLTVLPLVGYYTSVIICAYENSAQSENAIIDPPGGTFKILPNLTDISNYNVIMTDISLGLISIDNYSGIINFAQNIYVGIYNLIIYYTYNNLVNITNYTFKKQPTIKFVPNYTSVNYHDISFSLPPIVQPSGGTYNATLPLINLVYTGISIDKNTGILRFGLVNAGIWNLTVYYTYNGVTQSYPYKLEVKSIINWDPPYSVVPYNSSVKTKPAISQIPNGQYTSTSTIPGFSIDSITGVLTFNYIDTGVYFIPITYTFFGTSVVNNYILVVKPNVVYLPNYINTSYTIIGSSTTPTVNPNGGYFDATFNDDNLSPLNNINIDSISGIISTTSSLRVGIYKVLANYTVNSSMDSKVITITVYPQFTYSVGQLNILYGTIVYSETPITNPNRGVFKTNTFFYVDASSGIIEFKNTTPVGIYSIPISYTYNNLSITQIYSLVVKPIYYYSNNNIEIIIKNSTKSVVPYAKQEGGIFAYISVSGTLLIPYSITYLTGDQYIPNGIMLNGYTGILYFGNRILVGRYNMILSYSLYGLSTNTSYTITVRPYFKYDLTTLVLDYNTPAFSSIPIVDQSGGLFYFTNIADLGTEFNKITINNTTGLITFNKGIKVGVFKINVSYTVSQISNYNLYNLIIRPIYYYLVNSLNIIVDTKVLSSAPTVIQSGGTFSILEYSNLSIYNVSININTGVITFQNIPVGIYIFTLEYTLNGSSVTTTFNLTVQPGITYDINSLTLFYTYSGYSLIPYTPYSGGIFGFEDITSLQFMTTKLHIDISTGQIFFGQYINTGTYDILVNYIYNGIKNVSSYRLNVIPLIEYTISGEVLDYNHNIYTSTTPIINPAKGLFFFADNSNNFPIKEIQLDKNTGIIKITKLAIGNYNFGIKYYVKEFCSGNRFIVSILPTFYYDNNNQTTITYQNSITYSYTKRPFTDPSGGIFNFVYPLDNNLIGNMTIDSNTGIMSFGNFIEINNYNFNVYYLYNGNQTFINYNLVVSPLFYYLESINKIFHNNSGTSSIPYIYPYNGIFTIQKINIYTQTYYGTISGSLFNSILIDQYSGIININNNIDVGDYLLNITYTYKNIKSYFNYLVQILPIAIYDISNQIIVYGYNNYSLSPNLSNQNGLFKLDQVYNNNGIFIDASSGILLFTSNINVNYYPINISYTLIDINQILFYSLTVIPDLYYDSSNIIINYTDTYYSKIPFTNPIGGLFLINLGFIDNSGVFMINNLNVNNYNLIIKYVYNNFSNNYFIKLIVQPILYYYINFKNLIYKQAATSNYPYVNPPNGIFYLDVSNLTINSGGIISFDPNQYIGKYKINIYYNFNNIIKTTNYNYIILPYINYIESSKQIVGGTTSTSSIPNVNPNNGLFNLNNKNIIIDTSGIMYFNSNLNVGIYNLIINYSFIDLSNNFNYTLTITPYIFYNTKIIDFNTYSQSEIPINNSPGGIFSLTFSPNSTININSLNIDISNGLINFYPSINVNSYFFNVNYRKNNLVYTHNYNLIVRPVIIYNNININHNSSLILNPQMVSPIGGTFSCNNLPNFIILNSNTGVINIQNALVVGSFTLNIEYIFNNILVSHNLIINVIPIVSYNNNILIYLDKGSSNLPFVSISGGLFNSTNLPNGVILNQTSGIFNFIDTINVNNYFIKVNYLINDVSGFTIYKLTVKPYYNYITGTTIDYGSTGASIVPITNPTGGTFYLPNNYNNININNTYGILSFGSTVIVGQYTIPAVYIYNDISSTYNFNLTINPKVIYAEFIPEDKIYDATTRVRILSNKLFGVINDDKVYIDTYTAYYQTIGPGYNIPLFVYNLTLGGPEINNYILQYDNLGIGNIYLFKYEPNYFKINQGDVGNSLQPILSSLFTNPSYLLINISISSLITISDNIDIRLDPFGVIYWKSSLKIGTYTLTIKAYNSTLNSTYNYTLEVTQNIYKGDLGVVPPLIPNTTITTSVSQLPYSSTTGKAYVLNDNINGLVGQFSINAYNATTNNLTHNLGSNYPFTFKLNNVDPSANLITYEQNDDGTVNYSVGYKLVYVGDGYWTTKLIYLSEFIIQDFNALVNVPPRFDPPQGTYYTSSTVDVSIIALPNSIIFYTLDGSEPTTNSLVYSNPISFKNNIVIRAFAVTPGHQNSTISTASYTVFEVPCLLSKTLIRTPYGNELIDNLKEGDLVVTGDNRYVPIIKILKYTINNPNDRSYPICIPKNYFNLNVPDRNTYVSQNHAIKLQNNWFYGGDHLNHFELYKIKPTYYHIMLPNYFTDDLIANNLVVESWTGGLPKNGQVRFVNKTIIEHKNKKYITYKKILNQNIKINKL